MAITSSSETIPLATIRDALRGFEFARLFNELGWNHLRGDQFIAVGDATYTLRGIAEKRGFQVFRCEPGPDGAIPDRPTRRRIDREVTKLSTCW